MSIAERPSLAKSLLRDVLPSETSLIAIIAILFFILHIIAGTIIQNAHGIGPATSQNQLQPALYD
jgi:hypothetical protein